MSIDMLQDKIRKLKNPSMISLEIPMSDLPPHLLSGAECKADAYGEFCIALLEGLKGIVPAARVPVPQFLLSGIEGYHQLTRVLNKAKESKYYVLLDGFDFSTPLAAQLTAEKLSASDGWDFDGIVVPSYLGSDCMKPFLPLCEEKKKDLFVLARTSNQSAPELQDLQTGSRCVHAAAMDLVNRYGQPLVGKRGYSQVAAIVGAGAPAAIRNLRSKFQKIFFLLDGYDYPNGNAKNCSYAFDQLGHGAIACAGGSITGAWKQNDSDGTDFVDQAVEACARMRKNLTRYITIL